MIYAHLRETIVLMLNYRLLMNEMMCEPEQTLLTQHEIEEN